MMPSALEPHTGPTKRSSGRRVTMDITVYDKSADGGPKSCQESLASCAVGSLEGCWLVLKTEDVYPVQAFSSGRFHRKISKAGRMW